MISLDLLDLATCYALCKEILHSGYLPLHAGSEWMIIYLNSEHQLENWRRFWPNKRHLTPDVRFDVDSRVLLSFSQGFYWENSVWKFSHLKSTNCVVSKKCALLLFMLHTSRFSANEITCSVSFTGHNVLIQVSFPKGLRGVRVFWLVTPNKEVRVCCVVPITSWYLRKVSCEHGAL